MQLNQQLIIHSTDAITEYLGAKQDVERLVDHIKVQSKLPAGMALISVGQDAPDQQYQDAPWLKLDESNNPIALQYFNGSSWESLGSYRTLQTPSENLFVQHGSTSYSHTQGTVNTWMDSKTIVGARFLFPEPFKASAEVIIQITPTYSTIMRSEGAAALAAVAVSDVNDWINESRKGFEWALGADVDYAGFNMMSKTQDIVTSGLPFDFNWMAIGERA